MDTSSEVKELLEMDEESAINSAGNGKLVTPQKHEAEVTPSLCRADIFKSPLNFSTVTVEQLGITPESFVKNTPGKPSSYLKKSRRRSTIGARGSPETNHLICFIAQQRNLKNAPKSPIAQNSPFQGSPVLYRKVNSLREQISAFQTAFHSIKENETMADCPEFSETDREFETTDFIKKEHVSERQQSGCKRRRISYQRNCNEHLTEAEKKGNDLLLYNTDHFCRTRTVETSPTDLSEKSSGSGFTQSGWLVESVPLSDLTVISGESKGSSSAVPQNNQLEDKLTEAVSINTVPDVRSPVTLVCKKDTASCETFVLRSVLKKPSVKVPESLQEHCDNLLNDGSHPSLISNRGNCCKEPEADQENCRISAFISMRKRKRVTFGEDLSPEVFDESLPANTPLRKGGTPVLKKDLNSVFPLRLDCSPVPEQLSQPNFDDKGENLENIEPLQVSLAVVSPPSKSSVSETLSAGADTFSSSDNQENMSSCEVSRVTRASNRRNLTSFAEESVCNLLNTEAERCKEKRTNRKKSQENKPTNRALPKRNQVLKSGRKKKGKGKQSIKKSLYGAREVASKKPLLSPIPEIPEVSEMTPLVPSVQRVYSDNFNSCGRLEEVLKPPKNLMKRKTLLTLIPEDLCMNQSFDKCDVSEFCSSYIKSPSLLGNTTFHQDSNTKDIEVNENIPKVGNILESENELEKTEAGSENTQISCASVTEEYLLSDHPKPVFILQSQEFTAGGQNVKNLCQVSNISEDTSVKYEKQDDFLVAIEGDPKSNDTMSDSQKDIFTENIKETNHHCEDIGRKSTKNSSEMTCKERKYRRRSVCYPDSQSLHFEKNENHKNASTLSSSGEINLENSELYKDLSDAIEQTFKRTDNETKVRRSTRLQKDLEHEGLIWVSLPLPSTCCTSQKTKRRTVGTFDSRGFESLASRKETVSSRQNLGMSSSSVKENREDSAANSANLLGKRRKSFCMSTLANTKNTPQAEHYRRRSFVIQKAESSVKD